MSIESGRNLKSVLIVANCWLCQVNISNRTGVQLEALNISSLDSYCVVVLRSANVRIHGSDIGPCGAKDSNHWDGKHTGTLAPNHQGVVVASSSAVSITDSYIHSEYHATNSSHKPWHIPCVNCPPTHALWGNGCGCVRLPTISQSIIFPSFKVLTWEPTWSFRTLATAFS